MNTPFFPKVSIVIPVYNGANYLRESIESALAQTYANIEVLVINDGSTDDGATEAIALSYGDKIRYFKKENGGVSSALNMGIKNMTGDYFSWLSHDDAYEPKKVAASVEHLASLAKRDRVLVMCGGYYIDKDSRRLHNMNFHLSDNRLYNGIEVVSHILKHGVLDACCLLIPKIAFDECGFFDEDLRYNQDALMWYRFFSNSFSLVVNSENRHVMYRLHAAQTSKTRRDLLLRDSYRLTCHIGPTFVTLTTPSHRILHLLAKKNARHDCVDAVNECIRLGKESGLFRFYDICYLHLFLMWGKCRNLLKKIYHHFCFHK